MSKLTYEVIVINLLKKYHTIVSYTLLTFKFKSEAATLILRIGYR